MMTDGPKGEDELREQLNEVLNKYSKAEHQDYALMAQFPPKSPSKRQAYRTYLKDVKTIHDLEDQLKQFENNNTERKKGKCTIL